MTLSLADLKIILPNPQDIVRQLDEYIIGQDNAKKMLALMLLNRALIKLNIAGEIYLTEKLQKANVLLMGHTGAGKTSLIKALDQVSGVPISISDITSVTAAGYVGGKVEDILVKHINTQYDDFYTQMEYSSDAFRQQAETGIIYIDEIDKACKRHNGNDSLDVNGDMIQNELLKFLDGADVNLHPSHLTNKSFVYNLKTDNIMFICGGAFSGLTDIIARRIKKHGGIGFTSDNILLSMGKVDKEDLLQYVIPDDLFEYGFKAEFLGRLPLRSSLQALTPEMYERIIREPKGSVLKQYQAIFNVFGIELDISNKACTEMAGLASHLKMGARALRPIFNKVLEETLFNLWDETSTKLTIQSSDIKKIKKEFI